MVPFNVTVYSNERRGWRRRKNTGGCTSNRSATPPTCFRKAGSQTSFNVSLRGSSSRGSPEEVKRAAIEGLNGVPSHLRNFLFRARCQWEQWITVRDTDQQVAFDRTDSPFLPHFDAPLSLIFFFFFFFRNLKIVKFQDRPNYSIGIGSKRLNYENLEFWFWFSTFDHPI